MDNNRQFNNEWNQEERIHGTYQEMNPSYNAQAYQYSSEKNTKEDKKEKKSGKGKKIAGNLLGGVVFGSVAALSFFAVKEIGEAIGIGETATIQEVVSEESANSEATMENVQDEVNFVQTQNVATTVVTDVTEVVEQAMPAVVSITNNFTANYYYYTQEEQSSGSGIIIGSNETELLIVTNYHVIEGNNSLQVVFSDGTEVEAQMKGTDTTMDLAIIAVNYEELSEETIAGIEIAAMGDSENLRIGEPVIAIGNALGYGQSVTTGVVSAVNRHMDMDGIEGTFIQTDAAINPGNSGGALLNIAGEVIGINSNKIGGSVVEGMGYAIPISAAMPIIEELMQEETRIRVAEEDQSYLGISGANITQEEAEYYGYPEGVYVANIYEDTAADASELRRGDFIVAFDGEPISTMEELQNLMQYYAAGTTVELQVMRESSKGYVELTIEVTLGNRNNIQG